MGRRGRPAKPTELKRRLGNPGKRPLNDDEPEFETEDLGAPPAWMDKLAQAEWRRVAPQLQALNLLQVVDRAALEGYCVAYGRWREAEAFLSKHGTTIETPNGYEQQRPEVAIAQKYHALMRGWAAEFGFTPVARRNLKGAGTGAGKPQDPDEAFFGQNRKEARTADGKRLGNAAVPRDFQA